MNKTNGYEITSYLMVPNSHLYSRLGQMISLSISLQLLLKNRKSSRPMRRDCLQRPTQVKAAKVTWYLAVWGGRSTVASVQSPAHTLGVSVSLTWNKTFSSASSVVRPVVLVGLRDSCRYSEGRRSVLGLSKDEVV